MKELKDRDIISDYDKRLFWNLKIGRSIHHFAHPWNNESTEAGLLRMRLEEFDRSYPNIKMKSKAYREKEENFEYLIYEICDIAKKYNFNVWEGRSKNRFSITLSTFINRDTKLNLSIKLCKDNIYRACYTNEWNPNNNKSSEYTIKLGTKEDTIRFIKKEIEEFFIKYGMQKKQEYVFTINPIHHLKEDE